MAKVAFHTFGCRANQYDTEMMKEELSGTAAALLELVPDDTEADIYVVNTCTVTRRAEYKARQYIRNKAKRNGGLILVTGCYADVAPEEVAQVEGVDIVFGNQHKTQILEIIRRALRGERGVIYNGAFGGRDLNSERISRDTTHNVRAFVKIQDGCSQFCTFCKTVYARGLPSSKSLENIVSEVRTLVEHGFKEIVLTGINLAQYSAGSANLTRVLEAVAKIEGLERIRLSSLNLAGVTRDLVELFAQNEKACPHFHIPLQSGDDEILKKMRRGYTTQQYKEVANLIKERVRNATLGTDILVGFPGETEKHFENTCRFVEEIGFANVHIFRYSERPGTAAHLFKEQIDGTTKQERARKLKKIATQSARKIKQSFVGQELQVLVEERADNGRWRGYSENYLDVQLYDEKQLQPGQIVKVKIQEARKDYLLGVMSVCQNPAKRH